MTSLPAGTIATLTTVDSEPAILVLTTDDGYHGVLLADLDTSTLRQLRATADDPDGRSDLVGTLRTREDLLVFQIPPSDLDACTEAALWNRVTTTGGPAQ